MKLLYSKATGIEHGEHGRAAGGVVRADVPLWRKISQTPSEVPHSCRHHHTPSASFQTALFPNSVPVTLPPRGEGMCEPLTKGPSVTFVHDRPPVD